MNRTQSEVFNLKEVQKDYIARALSEQTGLKYLVLDPYTMSAVNLSFFRSELYQFSVFDTIQLRSVETLTTQGSTTGVFLIQPTEENVSTLVQVLSNPPFDLIYLCTLLVTVRLHQPDLQLMSGVTGLGRHKEPHKDSLGDLRGLPGAGPGPVHNEGPHPHR